jgi:hypothetical protein
MLYAFVWPNKSGPQLDPAITHPALIRPYPKYMTDALDDKAQFAEILSTSSYSIPTWRLDQFLSQTVTNKELEEASQSTSRRKPLLFLKHRLGAQGKSVYVWSSPDEIEAWRRTKPSLNPCDFVVQQEVIPLLDQDQRKFVLRCHVLVYQTGARPSRWRLHQDVICLTHASPYTTDTKGPKSGHISQAGKNHPPPQLLNELDEDHPACGIFDKVVSACRDIASAYRSILDDCPTKLAGNVTCFALLGVDLLVSEQHEIKICEINSHPALGWGSMSSVPRHVFDRLVRNTLEIVALNDTKQEDQDIRGFVEL